MRVNIQNHKIISITDVFNLAFMQIKSSFMCFTIRVVRCLIPTTIISTRIHPLFFLLTLFSSSLFSELRFCVCSISLSSSLIWIISCHGAVISSFFSISTSSFSVLGACFKWYPMWQCNSNKSIAMYLQCGSGHCGSNFIRV